MLQHHFKIIWRHIMKDKSSSVINLLGLTIGLTASMLIGIYVYSEWQTDRWIESPERTFRLLRVSQINNEPYDIGVTSAPFANALMQDYPADVVETVRVLDGNSLIQIGEQKFQEEQYYYVDSNFLNFFGYPLLYGDEATALSNPRSIVLTREAARRYFEEEEKAMGQTLRIDDDYDAVVTGVLEKIDQPSHLDFDLLESNIGLQSASWWGNWWNNMLYTYLRLHPGVSAHRFNEGLPDFMTKYFGKDFERSGSRIDARIQPIRSVYFAADTRYDTMRHGNKRATGIFSFAALLLLIIACANYVNLSTAQAFRRNKEVGVLKVLGSGRKGIVAQMLGKSFLFTLASILLALQFTLYGLPLFERMFDIELAFSLPAGLTIGAIALLLLLVTLASGLYPGLFLSSFKPVNVIKGTTGNGSDFSGGIRKTLVVFQFVLSVGLLCSTLLIRQQLNYLQQKSLGFDKEHVLTISINNQQLYDKKDIFKARLLNEPGVRSISFASGMPGGMHDATAVQLPALNKNMRMRTAFVDFEFTKTLGLEIVAGRDFDPRLSTDSTSVALLNERAVADLGLSTEEVLGQKVLLVSFDSIPKQIVGIVKNYHFSSLHDQIEPLVISPSFRSGQMAIKTDGQEIPRVLAAAEEAWIEHAPAFPFVYRFLDERLERLYQNEARQGRLFSLFALIAIFIACLGMFGLAAFAASTKTKEIGIRKVLGASVLSIIALLSKDFLKLVLIAFLIAIPLSWYFMNNWLDNFAYRINIQWWVFALTGLLALGIAFLTVSYQSIKVALMNPVESLRNE